MRHCKEAGFQDPFPNSELTLCGIIWDEVYRHSVLNVKLIMTLFEILNPYPEPTLWGKVWGEVYQHAVFKVNNEAL